MAATASSAVPSTTKLDAICWMLSACAPPAPKRRRRLSAAQDRGISSKRFRLQGLHGHKCFRDVGAGMGWSSPPDASPFPLGSLCDPNIEQL
eukprot:1500538-Alexandrium_andersonii.AAC.1